MYFIWNTIIWFHQLRLRCKSIKIFFICDVNVKSCPKMCFVYYTVRKKGINKVHVWHFRHINRFFKRVFSYCIFFFFGRMKENYESLCYVSSHIHLKWLIQSKDIYMYVATVNCQWVATASKRQDVLNFYKSKGYSILCLKDTYCICEIDTTVTIQWWFECVFSSYASNSRAVAIFFNYYFEFRKKKVVTVIFLALFMVLILTV